MPGTVKSELLPDADRSHKCDCQEKVSWKRNLPLDKSHFITEMDWNTFLKNKRWHSRMHAWNLLLTKKVCQQCKIVYEKEK